MKKLFITIFILLISFLLCSCTKYNFQSNVEALVIDKHYESDYTIIIPVITTIGNTTTTTMQTQYYPEEYNVKIKYEHFTTTIDNKELYNKLNMGDKVNVKLYLSKDKQSGYISLN